MSTLSREARHSYLIRVISPSANVLLLNAGCIGHHVTSSLIDVKKKRQMTLVLFKLADVNTGHINIKLNFFKRWYTKVYKKKNST